MVGIVFPGLKFGPWGLATGCMLDVNLLALHIVVPPWDLNLIPLVEIWKPFIIFDTDWILSPLTSAIQGVAKSVWDLLKGTLDSWSADFYKKHCTYEEYVRERDARNKASEKTE